jgi:hypothetical protein
MGALVLWLPFVFSWFVQRPENPRSFRIGAIVCPLFLMACALWLITFGPS